jgi:regulator of protease activity HflC (stomatin/prohibitin superfamily)
MLDQLLNYLTIIAWVIFGFFVLILVVRGFQLGGARGALVSLLSIRVLLALTVVLAISLLSVSLVFLEPQEVGVVVSLISPDGYREQPFRSGLHYIVPLAERVQKYPIFWQTYTMSADALEGEKVGDDSIAARTSDGQSVYVDCSVIFKLDANDVIRVHIDFQDRYIKDFVRPVLRGIVRTEVSQFTADEVNSSKRKDLESNLDEQLREVFGEKGFVLDRFLLRNIAFSPEYAAAIEAKQVAEQERTQAEYQAEQMRRLAEGTRAKYEIEAEGKARAIELEGQAAANVIELKAGAEAEALRLIDEALKDNEMLILYRYVDKLGQGIRVMLVPTDNPYLLPLPDLNVEGIEGGEEIPLPDWFTETITSTLEITPTVTVTPTVTP